MLGLDRDTTHHFEKQTQLGPRKRLTAHAEHCVLQKDWARGDSKKDNSVIAISSLGGAYDKGGGSHSLVKPKRGGCHPLAS